MKSEVAAENRQSFDAILEARADLTYLVGRDLASTQTREQTQQEGHDGNSGWRA
ncbi:MAG TPA: hypothetical protein VLV86_00060 [Vicinamibacterales bacterium]|nr:hypothetical protein [Vicinamibacterales bacterium]